MLITEEMQDKLLYIYLYLRTQIKLTANFILKRFFKVKSVHAVVNGKMMNMTVRYYLVNIINFFVNMLTMIRNFIDIECNKIQTTIRTDAKDRTLILDGENTLHAHDTVSLYDVSEKITNDKNNSTIGSGYIMTKIEIHHKNNEKVCFKKYVEKYKDANGDHHHTIKNIMLFNDVEYHPESKLVTEFFNNGKMEKVTYDVKDVEDEHINFISNKKSE